MIDIILFLKQVIYGIISIYYFCPERKQENSVSDKIR